MGTKTSLSMLLGALLGGCPALDAPGSGEALRCMTLQLMGLPPLRAPARGASVHIRAAACRACGAGAGAIKGAD